MKFIELTEKASDKRRVVNLMTDSFEESLQGVNVRTIGKSSFWFSAVESLEHIKALIREAGGEIGELKKEADVVD
jgi:hypothetical protein